MSSAWTDDRVAELTRLAAEGHSASQIAKALGQVSRSGVIGKLHRLGLNARAQPHKPGDRVPISRKAVEGKSQPVCKKKTEDEIRADGLRAPPVKRARRAGKSYNLRQAASAPRPMRNIDGEPIISGEPWVPLNRYDRAFGPLPGVTPRSFVARSAGQCRWPIDGAPDEFMCCAAPCGPATYCATHEALAHPGETSVKSKSANELMRSLRRHIR